MAFFLKEKHASVCCLYISTVHIAEIQYQGMINHAEKDVAALKWTYTEDTFILYRICYSCSLLGFLLQ